MACRQCGAVIAEELKFCPHCGAAQGETAPAAAAKPCAWPEWELVQPPIGRGSYGTVYKAVRRDHNLESVAAIKVISIPSDPAEVDSLRSEGMSEDASRNYLQGVVDDFVSEIRLMEKLKGLQNIVSVEDYKVVEKTGEIGWDISIRMELLTPFSQYTRGRTLTEAEVIKLGTDICTALEICAKRKIIHRDIKPENIFLNDLGDFKLGDFGIARKLENMTSGLSQRGTYSYMAPEVLRGAQYDARADVYSLGVVLYRLLNGNRLPLLNTDEQSGNPNERRAAIDRRLRGETLPPPCNASAAMAEVILRACAYEPSGRFASATEMKQALSRAAEGVEQNGGIGTQTVSVRAAQAPAPATGGQTAFCWQCGAKIPAQMRFCPRCGMEQESEPAPQQKPSDRAQKTRGNILIAGVIGSVCLLLVILGLLVYWVISNANSDPVYYISRQTYYDRSGRVDGWGESVYDEQGRIRSYTAYDGDGTVETWTDYTYDKNGNPLEDITYGSDGEVDSRMEYEYDSQGRAITETRYDSRGERQSEYRYVYDAQGRHTGGTYGDDGAYEEYGYNDDGQVQTITQYDNNGRRESQSEFTYDKDGNKIVCVYYDENGSVTGREEYTYDADGRVLTVTVYDGDGNVIRSDSYEYGVSYSEETDSLDQTEEFGPLVLPEDGGSGEEETTVPAPTVTPEPEPAPTPVPVKYVCVRETEYYGDGTVFSWYEYSYDADGNAIKCTEYYGDGSLALWREYTYDGEGKRIYETDYSSYGEIERWSESTYDGKGNEIRRTWYDSDGQIERREQYTYDDEGHCLKTEYCGADGEVANYEEHSYDADGNRVLTSHYGSDGEDQGYHEYSYDESGRMQVEIVSYGGGLDSDWYEYSYDENGNQTERRYYAPNGDLTFLTEYEYMTLEPLSGDASDPTPQPTALPAEPEAAQQYPQLMDYILAAGPDNTDFTYWTQEQQLAFWEALDTAGELFCRSIADFVLAEYGEDFGAVDFQSAASMWGYDAEDPADMWDQMVSRYGYDLERLNNEMAEQPIETYLETALGDDYAFYTAETDLPIPSV